ncbi:MAG: protein kinase [Anaerolineae bacterium]|nr:protein kinase [Anaerolineae bacterium]
MPVHAMIGRKLGDYTIQESLGQGGMAHVYKGFDQNLDRYSAVKVIEPNTVSYEDEAEYRERFRREARAIARLNHPNIVSVYQFGETPDNMYYMAMQFVDGRDLRQILKDYARRGQRMAYQQILQIVRDIASALDYAHQQGVIHRDVKPSNIMVTADHHAVLTDFGLALSANEGTLGNTFGSVHYIAPEQAVSSAQASPQSDLYSLGVVLYEMLTGRVPFDDSSAMSVALKHISDPPPPPSLVNPTITLPIEEVVIKMLDKEPRRRFRSGAAFMQALEAAFMSSDLDTEELGRTAALPVVDTHSPTSPSPHRTATPRFGTISPIDPDPIETITDNRSVEVLREQLTPTAVDPISTGEKSRTALLIGLMSVVLLIGAVILLAITLNNGITTSEPTGVIIAARTDDPTPEIEATLEATITEDPNAGLAPIITDDPTLTLTATETETETETETATPLPTETNTPTRTAIPPTVTPSDTATPAITATPELVAAAGEAQLLLRYDGDSVVVYNRDPSRNINIVNLNFVGRNAQGNEVVFNSEDWGVTTLQDRAALRPRDCFQVWSTRFTTLPASVFPADICQSRQGFYATRSAFWVNPNPSEPLLFEVRRGRQVLGQCPTVDQDSTREMRCVIRLDQ